MKRYISIILFLFCLAGGVFAQKITTGSLLLEMVNMERLTEFPNPSYKTIQFSSYDRRSIRPDEKNWFANSDGFGNEPIPGFEKVLEEPDEKGIGKYLICDVKGPGAIVRMWTARINGDLTVYLDKSKKPLYTGPATDFIKHTYKALGAKDKFQFSDSFTQYDAGYFPVPFSKGCRIEWTGDLKQLHFYHIQIRLYEKKAKVTTFKPEDIQMFSNEISNVISKLKDPTQINVKKATEHSFEERILSKNSKVIFAESGSKAISELTIKLQTENSMAALRQTVLNIFFDESPWPQVQSPVGDFFGAAPDVNPYVSVPFSVNPDGTMICRFVMPFEESVKIEIENRGKQNVKVIGSIMTVEHNWKEGITMHFRARWRVDHGLFASGDSPQDMPYLMADGKGRVVGGVAYVVNPTSVPSSWGNWWGEGDEKIYIDDDKIPSTFGTGSEDYFNYSWSSSQIFTHPYCGQPRNDGPANRGFVTNYRWHILDDLPFQNHLAFFMELYSHGPVENFSYARMVYYYGIPGVVDDHLKITDEDLRVPKMPKTWKPGKRNYTQKAMFYETEDVVVSKPELQFEKSYLWTNGNLCTWKPKNDELKLAIPVVKDDNCTIVLTLAHQPDGGKLSVHLDGKEIKFGENRYISTSRPYRILSRNHRLPKMKLDKGIHDLVIQSEDNKNIGIDFIWVVYENE